MSREDLKLADVYKETYFPQIKLLNAVDKVVLVNPFHAVIFFHYLKSFQPVIFWPTNN